MPDRVVGEDRIVSLGFWHPSIPTLRVTSDSMRYASIEMDFEHQFEAWIREHVTIPDVPDLGWDKTELVKRPIAPTVRTPFSTYSEWRYGQGIARRELLKPWHKDQPSLTKSDLVMAVWSNMHPTLARRNSGRKIYQAEPFEVILISNEDFNHRTPEMSVKDAKKRWFARAYLHPPATINPSEDVRIWKVR